MKPEDALRAERSEDNPERVEAIVKRARREVAARDLLEFGGGRIWLALLNILGRLMTLLDRPRAKNSNRETAGKINQREPEDQQ